MRFCERCERETSFTLDVPFGVQPVCDDCSREWCAARDKSQHLKTEHKSVVYAAQEGKCRFCQVELDENKFLPYEDGKLLYGGLCSGCMQLYKQLNGSVAKYRELLLMLGYIDSIQEEVTSKDKRWLTTCVETAGRFSTCAKAQHLSIIVTSDGQLVSEGWNGVPAGEIHCSMGGCMRAAEPVSSNSSYSNCLAQHAEVNAISKASPDELKGSTIYISGTPCHECVRAIIHSGISRAVFVVQDKYDPKTARAILGAYGVSVPIFGSVENEKDNLLIELQRRYKHSTTTDTALIKKIVSELQFDMMMDRVFACLQEKSIT